MKRHEHGSIFACDLEQDRNAYVFHVTSMWSAEVIQVWYSGSSHDIIFDF